MSDSELEKASSLFDKELDVLIAKRENLEKDLDAVRTIEKKIETVLVKSKEVNSEGDDLKVRDILLTYYSSECTVHGAYILTVAIGVFAFLQVVKPTDMFFVPFSLGLSMFTTIGGYLLIRIIFWGTIASSVTHLREIAIEEAEKGTNINRDKITFLLRLHGACIKDFNNGNKMLKFLVGTNRTIKRSLILYFVLFSLIALVFYLVQITLL